MTIELDAELPRVARRDTIHLARDLALWSIIGGLFAVAMLLRHFLSANTDVSWLLTVGERVLDGEILYRDVLETNPPKAVLVYLPGILLARTLGLAPELVTDGLVFAAIALSLGCAARLLKGTQVVPHRAAWPLSILAVIVLAILPMREFGQREHIAMLELLPAIAVLALRLKRLPPPAWGIVVAGIGLGLALSFKPYFALAFGGAVLALAWQQRAWRLLVMPEYIIAAAIVAGYAALVVFGFPDYLAIVGPLARDVYVPTGLTLTEMVQRPVILPFVIAMIAAVVLIRRQDRDAVLAMLIVMALGFAAIFFLQRKGWSYHAYPMIVFAMLALGLAIARSDLSRARMFGALAGLALLVALTMSAFNAAFDAQPLEEAVARLGPAPKLLAITAEPGLGHPLIRNLHGTWVSRQQGLWVAGYANYRRKRGQLSAAESAVLDQHAARERDWLIADIRRTQPDVVLIDNLTGEWGAWVAADAQLSALLAPYTHKQTLNAIDILSKAK